MKDRNISLIPGMMMKHGQEHKQTIKKKEEFEEGLKK
jgi:hypothetical protein